MTNYHEVLRKHQALLADFRKERDAAFDAAVAAERREGETPEQTVSRMFREDHPQLRKFYGLPAQESA